jgi:hypothetical protein
LGIEGVEKGRNGRWRGVGIVEIACVNFTSKRIHFVAFALDAGDLESRTAN